MFYIYDSIYISPQKIYKHSHIKYTIISPYQSTKCPSPIPPPDKPKTIS